MLLGKHINRYYVKYWYFFLIGIAALVTVDWVQLYEPEFLGRIVDILSGDGDTSEVPSICLKLVGVAVVMCLGRMIWRFTLFNASQRVEAGIRREMFVKSERLSRKYFHENNVGSIMSWFTNDLETIEEYVGFGTLQLVDAFFLGILVICKMFLMDWVLAAFSMIPMVLIIIWGALVEKFMSRKWEERQKKYDELYDFTQENFTGIRVIKAFVKETAEIHAFAKVAKKNRDANISMSRVEVIFDCVIEIIIAAVMSMILGFGGWFVYCTVLGNPAVVFGHTIDFTAGELITYLGYFDSLVWPMIALGSMITMLSRAKTSLKRVNNFLDAPEDVTDPENAVVLDRVRGGIEFRNCSFSYPGKKDTVVLDNISLKIEAGETVGIIGRIGCGKSTIAATLGRMYNLKPETVFIDGQDIMGCTLESVRRNVAFVPQDTFLFSGSVKENIGFSRENITDDEIREAAVFADLDENIEGFPDKYDTITGERGITLSGGQKQRVSLARAYLKDAPIMILDDSVSAVDVGTEEKILRNIKEKRSGKTTIIIASRISTVSHLDKVIVLDEGRLEAFASPAELLEISPTYKKMAYLQQLEAEVEGGRK